ncbi:haloalkane dehalogenase [Planotetraspora kaengkrachanensis]|uniref:Haloalkane dehalogenase n=1 Tax=Planotetraspora kaengkrachanensis TaxID=575193 RepID=A0A8J3PYP1_9ACTN|nr:haloalkane dehalogenase [Planotetraspora kaengkrachanensis]GIG83420.1 haloalkane dehalogenase [Planotetraspora kaengkrachanensis]
MNTRPYAEKKFAEINGVRMAYLDEGEGRAIVFQHGNPTSAYLWRNVMPHLEGLGRLIACDLVGMGDSGKLPDSGPDRYSYQEQRDHLFALWNHLDLGDGVVLVLHDWGSALGFDWAFHNQDRVAGIAYMEAIVAPATWNDRRDSSRRTFQALRSPAGEAMVLTHNAFVEEVLPAGILRDLSEEEMAAYRAPYLTPGESRRPTLSWPRQLPIEGEPVEVVRIVEEYGRWLATCTVPKLFVNADPGHLLIRGPRDFCRTWPNQTEATVPGRHFVQEDSPDLIGAAVADFVRGIHG